MRPVRHAPVRQAVAFLTPLGRASVPSPAAVRWFPVVGAGLGLALGLLWWAAGRLWPVPVAAGLVVVADLALTGLLHVDGLVDTADGLLPPLSPERRLEVMADPRVGAFGIATATGALLLRWTALTALAPAPLLLGALWCASRTGMALVARVLPYARPGGLAQPFLGPGAAGVGAGGGVVALALAVWWHPLAGPAALAGAAAGGAVVATLAQRRLGGFTGDVLGATGVVAETVGLVVAAARW